MGISGYIAKYKTEIGLGLIALLGLYAAGNAYVNAGKTEHGDATDTGIKNAKAEMGLGLGGGALTGLDAINTTAADEITATPTSTPVIQQYVLNYQTPDGNNIAIKSRDVKDIEAVREYIRNQKRIPRA